MHGMANIGNMDRVWGDIAEPHRSPWWHALLVPPNRELKAEEWLCRFMTDVYVPKFTRQVCRSRKFRINVARRCAVIPGMVFVPVETLDIPRRDEVFAYAHVRGFMRSSDGLPQIIHKRDIDEIRRIEKIENLPKEAKGVLFKTGQQVRFVRDILEHWGDGKIFEIASKTRIGVEVKRLFGRTTRIYVPVSEIEAL